MEEQSNTITCLLCCDDVEVVGIGECNHKEICFRCIYKMRELKHTNVCPICNHQNEEVVATSNLEADFDDFNWDELKCWDEKWQLYTDGKKADQALNSLRLIKCFYPDCQDKQMFQSINFLKKHLKEKHKRFLCELCVEHKLCVLNEQELYTFEQLNNHKRKGDFDECGIFFLHPFCVFCKENFFDEEQFYVHLQEKHLNCSLCGLEHKFTYYNEYKNLELHFKMSHFICEDDDCQAKLKANVKNANQFVFRTHAEKDFHYYQYHDIGQKKKIDIGTLGGFDQNQKSWNKENSIRDKEGINMQNQFLSQRKIKQREAVHDHSNVPLDYREFYLHKYDDSAIEQERAFFDDVLGYKGKGGKKNYGKKGGNRGYQSKNSDQPLDNLRFQTPKLEEILILRHTQVPEIDQNKFDSRVEKLVKDDDDLDKYYDTKDNWYRRKINTKEMAKVYLKVLGINAGLRLFPHFIRSVDTRRQQFITELDQIYTQELKKLPKKFENTINTSNTYSDFIGKIKNEMEINIKKRIDEDKLDLSKKYKMDRARSLQFREILKRVSTPEMVHIKFGTNFGITVDTINLLTKKIYFSAQHNIQKYLDQITDTIEFLHLYLYFCYCNDMVEGEKQQKHHLSTLLLQDFFDKYPKYYKIYRDLVEQSSDEEIVEKPTAQQIVQKYEAEKYNHSHSSQQKILTNKKPKANIEEQKAEEFDTGNKFEFPNIIRKESHEIKKEEQRQQIKKKLNTTNASKWCSDGIKTEYQEDVELFPSLGGKGGSLQDQIYKKKSSKKDQIEESKNKRKEELDLQKQNGPSLEEQIYGQKGYRKNYEAKKQLDSDCDSEEEKKLRDLGAVKVVKGKKGKKSKKVVLAGNFGF